MMSRYRRMVLAVTLVAGGTLGATVGAFFSAPESMSPPARVPVPVEEDAGGEASGLSTPVRSIPPEAVLSAGVTSVSDAYPAGDRWVVVDGLSARWHMVSGRGQVTLTAGRAGDGPGELRNPVAVVVLGDTVLVGERTRGTIERFHVDGSPLDRIRLDASGCQTGLLRRMAAAGGRVYLLRECLNPLSGGSSLRVDRLGARGSMVADTTLPWTDLTGGGAVRPGRPILVGGGDRLAFGNAVDGCLTLLLPVHRRGEPLCHPHPPRIPLTSDERAPLEAAAGRLADQGIRVEVPLHRVPFDAVFLIPPDEVVFRTILDGDRRALQGTGGPQGGVDVQPLTFVGPSTVLQAGETLDGTWIWVAPRG